MQKVYDAKRKSFASLWAVSLCLRQIWCSRNENAVLTALQETALDPAAPELSNWQVQEQKI